MQTKAKEKINIVTLGCAKNLVDSEVLMTQLKGNKKDVFHQKEDIDPDVVIINTCGFIDKAKQESIDTILKHAKEKDCLLYTSPSPRDRQKSRMPSSA